MHTHGELVELADFGEHHESLGEHTACQFAPYVRSELANRRTCLLFTPDLNSVYSIQHYYPQSSEILVLEVLIKYSGCQLDSAEAE